MSFMLKDPEAAIDYVVDWRADYLDEGDSLADSVWTVDPAEPGGVIVVADGFTAGEARVKASGGIAGRLYRLTNRIRTAEGLDDQRSLTIRVEAR